MISDRADIYEPSAATGEFWQGEILSDVRGYTWIGPDAETEIQPHQFAVVLSADCDLTQDHSARQKSDVSLAKRLANVLLCDVYEAEQLRLTLKEANPNSKLWDDIKKNKADRYHYLAAVPASKDSLAIGLPALALDFKQYFCVSMEHLLAQLNSNCKRRCILQYPYAQHLAQRYFNFQCRIGLPIDHA